MRSVIPGHLTCRARSARAPATALAAFQQDAGLDLDERVTAATWQALVEAGYRLGERQLYLRSPMTRGDDVAELQRRLGALGFDAGRVDGIFGPDTAAALADFQRNSGLVGDGIYGPDTTAALARLGLGRTEAVNVAHVRELERLRQAPPGLEGRRAAIGEPGGLGALTSAVAHELRERDVTVAVLDASGLVGAGAGGERLRGRRLRRPPAPAQPRASGRLLPHDRASSPPVADGSRSCSPSS